MKNSFKLTIGKDNFVTSEFTPSSFLLVDFTKYPVNDCYTFTFRNDKEYSSLAFTFFSEQNINCYYIFIQKDGTKKHSDYVQLNNSKKVISIGDVSEISIVIPREKNTNVRTFLTLHKLSAK